MNIKIKLVLVLVSMLSCFFVFSQKKNKKTYFDSIIKVKALQYKSTLFFYESASFFVNKSWDSTLVYTLKILDKSEKKITIRDYAHYFRAYSFLKKKMLDQSLKEFNLISKEFEYYNHVKLRLGEIALEQGEFEKAIFYFKKVERLNDFNFKKSALFHSLGLCYLHLNQFEKSKPYLVKSIKLKEQQKDTIDIIGAYGDMANLYYIQYKDDLAIPYFEKAYHLSKQTKDYQSKYKAAHNMAVVEENRKNYKKAIVYRKEHEQWKDSLNDQNKIYEVAQLEKEFAVKQKQKEVNLLEVENKAKVKERNGLLYSALILLMLLGTLVYLYREKLKTNKIIVAQKETLDALNATKDKLFSIVSHV